MGEIDLDFLELMFWISIIMSATLAVISLMAVGKHASELQYQIARRLNGIRWIQSWINLRIHTNRVVFAAAFFTTSVLGLTTVDIISRTWIGRMLFMCVLSAFLISAVMDWCAEAKQLKILLEYEDVNKIPQMRVDLHALNNVLTEYFGLENAQHLEAINRSELQEQIIRLVKGIQFNLHAMDPSYKSSRIEADHANTTK